MRRIIFVAAVLLAHSSLAAPVTWTLDSIVLSNGSSSLTGSFVFDADTTDTAFDDFRGDYVPAYYSDFEFNLDGTIINSDNANVEYQLYHHPDNIDLGGGSDQTHLEIICSSDCLAPGFHPEIHLYFFFDDSLANSSGPVNIVNAPDPSREYLYSGVGGFFTGPEILSGSVVANVVPIPAAVWLFGSALAGLGWLRRKQSA